MFSFVLPDEFVASYAARRVDWGFPDAAGNALGEITFIRSYSRVKPDGTKERWHEVCRRVIEGMYSIQKDHCLEHRLPWSDTHALHSAKEAFDRMFTFKWLPPGRGLWMMGTEYVNGAQRNAASLQNCSFVSTADIDPDDPAEPFAFLMEASMLGIGVGFDTLGGYRGLVIHRPDVARTRTFVVPDSREGWVESVSLLLNSYLKPGQPAWRFDYSKVRPAGAPIRGFGGTASGPAPLIRLHEALAGLFDGRAGSQLATIDVVDVANLIGVCVVAGNVRRCLPAGTRVHTARGAVPIEDVVAGDTVVTVAGHAKVSAVFDQGVQRTVRVRHEFGLFECTPNHRVAVFDGLDSWTFKRADELAAGDHLVWDPSVVPGSNEVSLPGRVSAPLRQVDGAHRRRNGRPAGYARSEGLCDVDGCTDRVTAASLCNRHYLRARKHGDPLAVSTRFRKATIPALDVETAWLVGLIQGDGYVYERADGKLGEVSVACDPRYPGIVDSAVAAFARFGVEHVGRTGPSDTDGSVKLRVSSVELARWFSDHVKQPNVALSVPEWMFEASPQVRMAYLAGVFDADGSERTRPLLLVTTVYEGFARDVVRLAASLGVALEVRTVRENHPARWQRLHNVVAVGYESGSAVRGWLRVHSRKFEGSGFHQRSVRFGFDKAFGVAAGLPARYGGSSLSRYTVGAVEKLTGRTLAAYPVRFLGLEDGRDVATFDIEVEGIHQFTAEGFVVHNSAELALGLPSDDDFVDAKNPQRFPARNSYDPAAPGWGWMSNNSLSVDVGDDYRPFVDNIVANGEPGFVFNGLARAYGRLADPASYADWRVVGTNPCVPADTWVATTEGPRRVADLVGRPFTALVDGRPHAAGGFFSTGVKPLVRVVTAEGFEVRATADHRVLTVDGWVPAGDLALGSKVVLSDHVGVSWPGEGGALDGRLLGAHLAGQDVVEGGGLAVELIDDAGGLADVDRLEATSSEFQVAFLQTLFDVAAKLVGGRLLLRLPSGVPLPAVQRMLARLGVRSVLHRDLVELSVAGADLVRFAGTVGSRLPSRRALLDRDFGDVEVTTGTARPTATVVAVTSEDAEEVFDTTVVDVNAFCANGVYVHNCGEMSLESYEMCVGGDTMIHTRDGLLRIEDLVGREVEIWNGEDWSKVTPFFTGRNRLLRVTLSDGSYLDATPGHEWSVRRGARFDRVPTSGLSVGDVLPEFNLTTVGGTPFADAYRWGWFTGDGYVDQGRYPVAVVQESELATVGAALGGRRWASRANRGSDTRWVPVVLDDALPVADAVRIRTEDRVHPDVFGWDAASISDFMGGWIDTDGSLAKNPDTDHYVLYGTEGKLRDAQMLLRRIGVNHATLRRVAPKGAVTDFGTRSADLFRLLIPSYEAAAVATRLKRAERFGSRHRADNAHPGSSIDAARKQKVVAIELVAEDADTFCFTEPVRGMGVFANVLTHQCTLVEAFLHRHDTLDDFLRTLKFAYLYAKSVTLVSTHWPKTNAVMQRNRRIGCSISGIASFLDARGEEELVRWMDAGYGELGHWDRVYSEWLCVRESIKRSTVKPSGSVSIVAGSTPGVHWSPGGQFFLRTIRFGVHDPMVPLFERAGYQVEDDVVSAGTKVVYFPIHTDVSRSEKDVSIEEKIGLAALAQRHWSDNSVSVTVSFDPVSEGGKVGEVLSGFEGRLKSVSFLPMGDTVYPQQPYTRISADEYASYLGRIAPVSFDVVYDGVSGNVEAEGEAYCSTDVCEIPSLRTPGAAEFEDGDADAGRAPEPRPADPA